MEKTLRNSLLTAVVANSVMLAQIPITVSGSLPSSIDNSTEIWFPPVVSQQGESCGNAAGIGYIFNYEINAARGVSAKTSANQYPYFHTFDFLNNGDETREETLHVYYRHYLPAWKIVKENGIPNVVDFGTSNLNSTAWLHGYDKYYRSMQNRVDKIDSLRMTDADALTKMKQWLRDHGNGSSNGGIFLVTGNIYCYVETSVPSGPEAGKSFIKKWGWSTDPNDPGLCRVSMHSLALVGYNDSVRCDFNGDGRFTNNVDQNNDGKVDIGDWEIGAVKVANTWGTAAWDRGFVWAGYRTLVLPPEQGGIINDNYLYYITVKRICTPSAALKVNLTSSVRNTICLSLGVSSDQASTTPTKIRKLNREFCYSGGPHPARGRGASSSIEIGLDVSDLIDSLGGSRTGKFFLIVDSKGGTNTIDSLSFMDYTGGTVKQTKSTQTRVAVTAGTASSPARTYVGVAVTLNNTAIAARPLGMVSEQNIMIRSNHGTTRIALPSGSHCGITLYDMSGKQCARFSAGSKRVLVLSANSLDAGVYIMNIRSAGQLLTRKITIMR
ncbi:MAG: T9SS type A sorting domain-containing protein [Chitinispirillaceae bacterium]|nr:T9SS type A sorting domain-containing protein [Chitinispirillaceae bacterium]